MEQVVASILLKKGARGGARKVRSQTNEKWTGKFIEKRALTVFPGVVEVTSLASHVRLKIREGTIIRQMQNEDQKAQDHEAYLRVAMASVLSPCRRKRGLQERGPC